MRNKDWEKTGQNPDVHINSKQNNLCKLGRDHKKERLSAPTNNQIYGVPANQFSPSAGVTAGLARIEREKDRTVTASPHHTSPTNMQSPQTEHAALAAAVPHEWGKGGSRSMIVRPKNCASCGKGVYPLERVRAGSLRITCWAISPIYWFGFGFHLNSQINRKIGVIEMERPQIKFDAGSVPSPNGGVRVSGGDVGPVCDITSARAGPGV